MQPKFRELFEHSQKSYTIGRLKCWNISKIWWIRVAKKECIAVTIIIFVFNIVFVTEIL